MQLNRHAKLAREYWQTYRPQALTELGSPQEQEEYFYVLGMKVAEEIGQTADTMLLKLLGDQRAGQRSAVRAQAQELAYAERIYLPKEPGTESREM